MHEIAAAPEYDPVGHTWHAVPAFISVSARPRRQSVQEVANISAYLPASHAAHDAPEGTYPSELVVPGGHIGRHIGVAPASLVYFAHTGRYVPSAPVPAAPKR